VKARQRKWEKTAQYFVKELSSENVKAETVVPDPAKHEYSAQGWPQAHLTLDEAKLGITAAEMNDKLKNGNPPIYASQSGNQVTLNPQCLQDGEEKIIVKRIREIIEKKIHRKTTEH
jgi:seryl-tRNA(Sec) selenium transferase